MGLIKTVLSALNAYLQLRNKAFYYDITEKSRNKQQNIINEIETLRDKRSSAATERADLLQQQLIAEKHHLEHISAIYTNLVSRNDDSN